MIPSKTVFLLPCKVEQLIVLSNWMVCRIPERYSLFLHQLQTSCVSLPPTTVLVFFVTLPKLLRQGNALVYLTSR